MGIPATTEEIRAALGLDVEADQKTRDAAWKDQIRKEQKANPDQWHVNLGILIQRAYRLQIIDPDDFRRRMARMIQFAKIVDVVIDLDEQMKEIDPVGYDSAWSALVSKEMNRLEGNR